MAGILSWSPDRYDQQPQVEERGSRNRRGKREVKERKTLTKKGSQVVVEENNNNHVVRELAWLSDPELAIDVEHDPLLTSRTFDSYTATSAELHFPLSMSHNTTLPSFSNPTLLMRDTSMPPPTSHHSEEAFRTYLPSPASAEDARFFANVRRASSWGQGDKNEYEVQSITSDVAVPDAFEVKEHVMWRGSEGLYVMDHGVLVPVSTSFDEADHSRVSSRSIVHDGAVSPSLYNNGGSTFGSPSGAGPGPSTAWYRACQVASSVNGVIHGNNPRQLEPILDEISSSEKKHGHNRPSVRVDPSPDKYGEAVDPCTLTMKQGKGNHGADDEHQDSWSEGDEAYDDDDGSSDHALTFSPSNKRLAQYDNNDDHDDN